jgi:hypothetical protein
LFAAEESQENAPQATPEAESQQNVLPVIPEVLAIASAEQWLKVIDDNNYDKGWVYASEYLKNAVDKEAFKERLQGVRSPLGSMKKRVLAASQFAASLPGAPDGEYVVMKYKTEFSNKANAVETLISKKEQDGQWKVAGYYIK